MVRTITEFVTVSSVLYAGWAFPVSSATVPVLGSCPQAKGAAGVISGNYSRNGTVLHYAYSNFYRYISARWTPTKRLHNSIIAERKVGVQRGLWCSQACRRHDSALGASGVKTKAAARGQERQTLGMSEGESTPENPADGSLHGD